MFQQYYILYAHNNRKFDAMKTYCPNDLRGFKNVLVEP